MEDDWKLFNRLSDLDRDQIAYIKAYIKDLDKLNIETADEEESFVLLKNLEDKTSQLKDLKLLSILRLLGDFYRLNWRVQLRQEGLFLLKDPNIRDDEKKRDLYRKSYSYQRFDQLSKSTTRDFIKKMERVVNFRGINISILSLLRDGEDLSMQIKESTSSDEVDIYPDIINPYIQSVGDHSDAKICEHTGLKLIDIYRYFRFTWATPSNSIPGRTMTFLIRDAACKFHPIIGIFALSSAAPQLTKRDEAIGWSNNKFIDRIKSKPNKTTINLILDQIDQLINSIRVDDFLAEQLIKPSDLRLLRQSAIEKLDQKAKDWKKLWQKSPEQKKFLKDPFLASETYLYKSKRASELVFLLKSKFNLESLSSSKHAINCFLDSKENLSMLNGIAKRIRSRKLGVNIADLTVCGAIPPYNKLLGGKLVSALAVSPETINLYKKKYKDFESVIASNMAGKSVVKEADLVYISTTSLFGIRPSQYDNISIPLDHPTKLGNNSLKYRYLGKLEGGGSMHFSKGTTGTMASFMRQEQESKVNYVFGEGASPKLRAIRDGLRKLGFIGEDTIYHDMPKTLYGVCLIDNLAEYLMGFNKRPKYIFKNANPRQQTKYISRWWSKRWAIKRILRDGENILEDLAKDNLSFPIEHGGKVNMPEDDNKQITLNI